MKRDKGERQISVVEYIGTDGDWHHKQIELRAIASRTLTECMHNMKIDMLEFRFKLVCCIQLHNKNNISIIHNF